jgi:hypothetical protein
MIPGHVIARADYCHFHLFFFFSVFFFILFLFFSRVVLICCTCWMLKNEICHAFLSINGENVAKEEERMDE